MSLFNNKRARVEPITEPEPKKTYEEEFPSLVSSFQPSIKVWGGDKTFAELAKNLEIKKQETELKTKIEKTVKKTTYYNNIPLPQFNIVGHYTDDESSVDSTPAAEKPEEDEWVTVCNRKKQRKQKSLEEIANRPITPPDEPETNWDQEEMNENTEWGNY